MRVVALRRYPVKSMQGEPLDTVRLSNDGVEGDRRFGVLDVTRGTIISAKADGRLLEAQALMAGIELTVRLPTGETTFATGPAVDTALSAWLGKPVRLLEANPEGRGTYEIRRDFEDDASELVQWQGPQGSFVDSAPVHLLTTGSLRALEREQPDLQWVADRFRPNILIGTDETDFVEQEWIGRRLVIGGATLHVYKSCSRCVMTTRTQPGGITRQLDILRHLTSSHAMLLGVHARVESPGPVEPGCEVNLR